MATNKNAILALLRKTMIPAFKDERDKLDRIDKWWRWDHETPHQPTHSTREYKQLSERAQTPWLGLVVTSAAQGMYVDGYRRSDEGENARSWEWWQANKMDGRQVALHRAMLAYGQAYTSVLPGENAFGVKMPVIRGHSPRRMIAFYAEPEHDDYPMFALRMDPAKIDGEKGFAVKVYDDTSVHYLNASSMADTLTYIEARDHNLGVCPVVRYANQLDLEGRAPGSVEPFIPLAARIDQTVFDRLVVQRFASWKVRTIAGMAKPENEEEAAAERLRLKVDDLLVAEDVDTKFDTLEETPLQGFIEAKEADIKDLAAVSQTPAYELMGQLANLSAEALAAARASLTARVDETKMPTGESHHQTLQLSAHVMGDTRGAQDEEAQVRWRDTEPRSLAQAADALGKLAEMLGVPVELLWEKVPGFDEQDVERAKKLIEEGKTSALPEVGDPVPQ